jgi:hypothetical protein
MDKNLAAAAAVLEGGAGEAAPSGAVMDGGEGAIGAALGGGAGAVAAGAGAGAVADGAVAGGGAARTATETEAIYKEINDLYEANHYVEPCEVNLCLPS